MKLIILLTLTVAISTAAPNACRDASDYWAEADELIKHMSLDQKIGQMTQGDIP